MEEELLIWIEFDPKTIPDNVKYWYLDKYNQELHNFIALIYDNRFWVRQKIKMNDKKRLCFEIHTQNWQNLIFCLHTEVNYHCNAGEIEWSYVEIFMVSREAINIKDHVYLGEKSYYITENENYRNKYELSLPLNMQ